MSRRKKHQHIEALHGLPNVFEEPNTVAGTWHAFFGNQHPIIIECGCGKGYFATGVAARMTDANVIGIDTKGARLWYGATEARKQQLTNVAFVRCSIEELEKYIGAKEAAHIWITFPDPYPKKRHALRRLTSPVFLQKYKNMLAPGGAVHLKTDDDALFTYSLATATENGWTIADQRDNVPIDDTDPMLTIQTAYEQKHRARGKTIKYAAFKPLL